MKPYYYIFRVGGGHPRIKHPTLESAHTEAMRLAAQHPGDSFEIRQCLGVSSVPKASTFWMDGAEPISEAVPSWLDAEIEKASSQYAEAVAAYHKAEAECRNSSDHLNQASYYKGRRDALTALKESLK